MPLKSKNTILKFIIELLATWFFVGKIKLAPGTYGSLAALPLVYFLLPPEIALLKFDKSAFQILFGLKNLAILTFLLFMLGWAASSIYIKHCSAEQDPKEVVIDEVVGQMLTTILCFFASTFLAKLFINLSTKAHTATAIALFYIMPFILFRFFDIKKPWLVGFVDKNIKGGLGIMLDDVIAAIYASLFFYFFSILLYLAITVMPIIS